MDAMNVPTPEFMNEEAVRQFGGSVSRFLERHATPEKTAMWRSSGCVPTEVWKEAGRAGLLGVSIPEQYGGAGVGFEFEAALIEQLGRYNALNFSVPLHNAVVAPYIVDYGTEQQRQRYLPGAVTGDTILAIAMSEPGAGSDLQGMKTTAVRDGDHYVLNGQKTFISNGLLSSVVIVAAKTNPELGAKGLSLFICDTDTAGFERGRLLHKLGQEGRDTVELFFQDMRIPAENLLGEEGSGFSMMMEKLPQERLVIGWQAMSMIESALNCTVDYSHQRRAFGRTIFDFQNSQFKLAECLTQATVAKVFLYHCTEQLLSGGLDAATASMAKYWITEAQGRIIDECLQLHGGYGYMTEYPIAEMYKDARAYRIYGGTSEIMKLLIARSLKN
ncbi:acyl-CoA dehydrogenase family protein [Haliea sp.]